MSGRKILIGSIFLALALAGAVDAQKKGKPDFTGRWVLDETKSKSLFGKSKGSAKAVDANRRVSSVIVIEHVDPKFTATEFERVEVLGEGGVVQSTVDTKLSEVVYFTDGRGETNVSQTGQTHPSKMKWIDNALRAAILLDEEKSKASVFVFELSKKGKELSVINIVSQGEYDWDTNKQYSMPIGLSPKKVYNKVE